MKTNIQDIIFDRSYIGQEITCMKHGKGIIIDYRKYNHDYPVVCEFLDEDEETYEIYFTKEGYYMTLIKIRFIYLGHDAEFSVIEALRDSNSINEMDKVIALNEPGII